MASRARISQSPGKQQGFVNDSGESTRFRACFLRLCGLLKELRPRYAIAENVKALTSTKFKNEFATVLSSLEEAGYNNLLARAQCQRLRHTAEP